MEISLLLLETDIDGKFLWPFLKLIYNLYLAFLMMILTSVLVESK